VKAQADVEIPEVCVVKEHNVRLFGYHQSCSYFVNFAHALNCLRHLIFVPVSIWHVQNPKVIHF